MVTQERLAAERLTPGSSQSSPLSLVPSAHSSVADVRRQVFEQAFNLSENRIPPPESARYRGKRNKAKPQTPVMNQDTHELLTPEMLSSSFPVQVARTQAPDTPQWHFAANTLARQRKDESHLVDPNFRPVLENDEFSPQNEQAAASRLASPSVPDSQWKSPTERDPMLNDPLASRSASQAPGDAGHRPDLSQTTPQHRTSRGRSPAAASPAPGLSRRNATRLTPAQYIRQIFRRLKFWRRGRRPMFPKAFLRRKPSFIMAPDRSSRRFRFRNNKIFGKAPVLQTENVARPQMSSMMKLTDSFLTANDKAAVNTSGNDRASTPGRAGKLSLPPRAETCEPRWQSPAPVPSLPANKHILRPEAIEIAAPPRPPRPERSRDLPPVPANQARQPAQLNLEDSEAVSKVLPGSGSHNGRAARKVLENAASTAYVSAHTRGLSRESRASRYSRGGSRASRKTPVDETDLKDETIDEALEFVSVWGSYLRHSIAIRALLRKEIISLEQEEANEWSSPESDASSISTSAESVSSGLSTIYSDISQVPDLVSSNRPAHNEAIAAARAALESRRKSGASEIDMRRPSRRVSHLSRMPERYSNLFLSDQESIRSLGVQTPEDKQGFWAANSAAPEPVQPPIATTHPDGEYAHVRKISTSWAPTREHSQRSHRGHGHSRSRTRSSVPSVIIPRQEEDPLVQSSKRHSRYSSAAYSRDYSGGVLNLSTWRSFSSSDEIVM